MRKATDVIEMKPASPELAKLLALADSSRQRILDAYHPPCLTQSAELTLERMPDRAECQVDRQRKSARDIDATK